MRPSAASTTRRRERRVFRACFSGWAADAYDNQIVAVALPWIVASLAMSRSEIGTMVALTVTATAAGGWLGGAAADRWGRLTLLRGSILWFLAGSLAVSCADDATSLAVARIVQGFGLGAEWAAGAALMAASAPPERRGRALARVQSGWAAGWGAAVLVVAALPHVAAPPEAWRWAVLLGTPPAILALLSTRGLADVPASGAEAGDDFGGAARASPFAVFTRPHLRSTMGATLLGVGAHGGYYGVFTWIPTYLKVERGMGPAASTLNLLVIIVAFGMGCIASGQLADAFGRRRTLVLFALCCTVVGPAYVLLTPSPGLTAMFGALLGFCAAGVPALIAATIVGLFPARMSATGLGFCYNAGRLIGALIPLATGWMGEVLSLSTVITIAVMGAYGMVVVATVALPRSAKGGSRAEPA